MDHAASVDEATVPLANFERSLGDAERMLRLASGLADIRVKRMRADFKRNLGSALGVRSDQRHLLERAEGSEAWVIIKPNAQLRRDMFGKEALAPLIRQAVVVTAAAVETYVSDRVVAALHRLLQGSTLPASAADRLADQIKREASADPSKISLVFRRIGTEDILNRASHEAGFKVNSIFAQLARDRNVVAHGGTLPGLTQPAAIKLLEDTRSAVQALDRAIAAAGTDQS